MKKIVKQVLGVDVAQNELVCSLGRAFDDCTQEIYVRNKFPNNLKGFGQLISWVKKNSDPAVAVVFVMEATGVYHESFAYYLADRTLKIAIVLPNKISNYMRSLTIKTVNDQTAANAICQFGLERQLDYWEQPDPTYRQMKQLTRERDQIIDERTMCKNQLHAEKSGAFPNARSIKRLQERIKLLDKHIDQIAFELKTMVAGNEKIKEDVKLLCTIPGLGHLTACIILAETNGFELIRNKKQLTSYTGLDIREKQSGTSIKGKSRISKRGNRFLRKALYLPALAAIRHNERYKAVFSRQVQKHGIKMKGAVAVQRKLLELSYILHKTRKAFDPELFSKSVVEFGQSPEMEKGGTESPSTPLQSSLC